MGILTTKWNLYFHEGAIDKMCIRDSLIPILVLLFYFWMAKILLGVNVDIPMVATALSPRTVRRRVSGAVKGGGRA